MPINRIINIIDNKFSFLLKNYEFTRNQGLQFWREKIFNGLMFVVVIFGTIAMIPNIIASITTQSTIITVVDIFVYLSFISIIVIRKRIKLKHKVVFAISLVYLLSITLLFTLGPVGPGLIWLASASLIAALLLGLWASILTIVINVVIILLFALIIHLELASSVFSESYTVITWIAVSSNIVVVNSITSIPLALLLKALEESIKAEQGLKEELLIYNHNLKIEKLKAQESDRLKSAFLANLSHDIRTPMNAIMGFSEILDSENIDQHLKKYTHQIFINAQYLQNLINDIVDISIIESGKIRISYETTTLKHIFEKLIPVIDTLPYWKNRAKSKITYPEGEILETQIKTDTSRLLQVLINLISNAIKFTPEGKISIKAGIKNKTITFCVCDNGLGIPDAEQQKIFDRFTKINRPKGPTTHGIGLGLSICKAIITTMGGKIWFTSKEKLGTSFYFSLPQGTES
ncbi:MAG: HAMP domain-containing histidine kinase [Prolixibacteraceae bacterium]|nr:HAMP domain-containing histidine kinase [Prolixibacteraceae bacterium]